MSTTLASYIPANNINLFNDFFSKMVPETHIDRQNILHDGLKQASKLLADNEITKQEYEKFITELMAYFLENEISERIDIIFDRWLSKRKRF